MLHVHVTHFHDYIFKCLLDCFAKLVTQICSTDSRTSSGYSSHRPPSLHSGFNHSSQRTPSLPTNRRQYVVPATAVAADTANFTSSTLSHDACDSSRSNRSSQFSGRMPHSMCLPGRQ